MGNKPKIVVKEQETPPSCVPCEQLFSAAKKVADDWCSHLGSKIFKELQIMKFTWHNIIARCMELK
jgi:hypothetical protein